MKPSSSVFFSSNKTDAEGGDGGVSLQQEVNWSDLLLKCFQDICDLFSNQMSRRPTHIRGTEAGNVVFSLFAFKRLK